MLVISIILVCLFLNAILSCVEMAFVTVSKAHLKQIAAKGNLAAKRVLRLKENPERALSVLQIGITFVGAISAAVGGIGAEGSLAPMLQERFGLSLKTAEFLALTLAVLPLTYLSVVIGELVPKSLALKYPMRFALMGGVILQVLNRVFAPFVFLLEISTVLILKMVSTGLKEEKPSELNTSLDLEPLSEVNKQYVLNLISLDKRTVKDIFVPWDEVSKVNYEDHYRVILKQIQDSRHTRLPVLQEDQVVGFLHAKEFISEGEVSRIDWTELIRPVIKLSPKMPILVALKKMQGLNSHLAVIMDNEEPLGIVTMEDVFEEVVGEIYDENENPRVLLSSNSKIRTMNLGEKNK